MTDKQIIEEDMVNAKDFCPYYSCEVDCSEATMCQWFVDTLQQLKRKEKECEELKEDRERWKSNFNDKVSVIEGLLKQFDQLKAENETYKKMFEDKDVRLALIAVRTGERHLWFNKAKRLEQTLTEIKEVLQFYNNITLGTYKGKGVFEFEVCNENTGKLIYYYDTNPAKQALQKIKECVGNNE